MSNLIVYRLFRNNQSNPIKIKQVTTMANNYGFKEVRQSEIYNIIKKETSVSVNKLVKMTYSSPATIRRDLEYLERGGLIRRVHGGAVIVDDHNSEPAHVFVLGENADKKMILCRQAAKLVQDNMTIALDGSTTLHYLIPLLKSVKNLRIITNSYRIAEESYSNGLDAEVFLAGGKVLGGSQNTCGGYTLEFLRQFYCDYAFIACRAVSPEGDCSVVTTEQAQVKRQVLSCAKRKVLLCDSTKFGKRFPVNFYNVSDLDYLVCDAPPSGDLLAAIQASRCKLLTPGNK